MTKLVLLTITKLDIIDYYQARFYRLTKLVFIAYNQASYYWLLPS